MAFPEEVKGDETDMEDSDDEESKKKQNQLETWRSATIDGDMNTVYIEKFKGSPLSADVSIFK